MKHQLWVKCARCVGGAIGTRRELYQAYWRERVDGQWECNTHRRKGDDAGFKTFHHERAREERAR